MKGLICGLATAAALFSAAASGQTYDLRFVEVQNNGTTFDVKLQIMANDSFRAGSGNLVFTYAPAVIATPSLLTAHNFNGGVYNTITLTQPVAGRVSVNIELFVPGSGTTVPLTPLDVVTLRFVIADPVANPLLQWRTNPPNQTNLFLDDNATLVAAGTFTNLDSPLPVQLVSFTAVPGENGHVLVDWTTLTETNNYGFEVQKSPAQALNYQTIESSFVAGHGTTTVPQHYAFVDIDPGQGRWRYRLKQFDLDGPVHYTAGVEVDLTAGVGERPMPTEFALAQNYPNPFNPSTVIEFALPQKSPVTLQVFDIRGALVSTLVNEVLPAGYHAIRFDATGMASGLYLTRLRAVDRSFQRKMLLVK